MGVLNAVIIVKVYIKAGNDEDKIVKLQANHTLVFIKTDRKGKKDQPQALTSAFTSVLLATTALINLAQNNEAIAINATTNLTEQT